MNYSVTVLIPAQGKSPFISETLLSIEGNSLLPHEILIIDDGLTESALSTIKQFYARLPIKLKKNSGSGLVDALNTGLKVASAEFICRIDGDDLMKPERITTQLRSLQSNKQLVAVGSQCVYIDENSLEIGFSKYPVGMLNSKPEFKNKCLIAHPSTMYCLDSAFSIGGYRSLFKWNGTDIAEDYDFWIRLSRVGQIEITNDFLTKYRQHRNQISSKSVCGQILGTPYISAIHRKDGESSPIQIEFRDNQSLLSDYYFSVIRTRLGWRVYSVCKLTLLEVRFPKWLSQSFFGKVLRRIINLLNR
jgi:glycosyltransferase involved in cell wall biosynthesis